MVWLNESVVLFACSSASQTATGFASNWPTDQPTGAQSRGLTFACVRLQLDVVK